MDVIRIIGTNIWDWMGHIPVEFTMFIVRYNLILIYCSILAYATMLLFRNGLIVNTFPFQILSVVLAIIIGMAIPMDSIKLMGISSRNILFMFSLCLWFMLPSASVRYLVRRQGLLPLAYKISYCLSFIFLIIQTAVCIGAACLKR